MNVYIGGAKDYSAMRGPAPDGFHVPLSTEWQGLKTIMDGLGLTTGDNWRINLHMPFAGLRRYSSADLDYQGSYGYYWSSSPYGSVYPDFARNLYLNSSYVYANDGDYRARGFSVRCFKNSFELPTSSWTVVQGTLGSAGIFWNTVNGLISITGDGTTGYTIQDKNLGATTVYSDGDTLSESNCGRYYQWGNNYGFAWTGSVTKSSTQVDASSYGPGNYYSSSTYITGNQDWSSVQNDNLRGGVTGVVSPAPLKNAYIGEVWTPGSNTLLYLPLEKDATDYSGRSISTTASGVSYTTIGGVKACSTGNPGYITINQDGFVNGNTMSEGCISLLYYLPSQTSARRTIFEFRNKNYCACSLITPSNDQSKLSFGYGWRNLSNISLLFGQWVHLVVTGDNSSITSYVNGNAVASGTTFNSNFWLGDFTESGGENQILFYLKRSSAFPLNGYVREFIVESRKWDAAEVEAYNRYIRQKLGF